MLDVISNNIKYTLAGLPVAAPLIPMIWWQIILILIAAGIIIGGLIILINKITGGNFKLFNFISARRNNKKEINDDIYPTPHTKCPHRFTLLYPITKISDISIQVHDIKTRDIIGSQMMKAEETMLNLKNISLSAVSTFLKNHIEVDCPPVHHQDYLNYKTTLHECFARVKDIIRAACIKNGFDEKCGIEYDKYIEEISSRIATESETFFSENFINIKVLTFDNIEKLKVSNSDKLLTHEYADQIKMLFNKMKDISLKKQAEIEGLMLEKDFLYTDLGICEKDKN